MLREDSVAAETNWVLDVVLRQHPSSIQIFDLMVDRELVVHVPATSLVEAVKRIERMQGDLGELRRMLERRKTELQRGETIRKFAQSLDAAELALGEAETEVVARFWDLVQTIARHATILPIDESALRTAQDVSALLDLSPADALVLASVALNAPNCGHFVSRDRRAFDRPEVASYFEELNVIYHRDPAHFLSMRGHT